MAELTESKQLSGRLGLTEEEWLQFLLVEGLEVLAAYRGIPDRAVRQMFLHRMQEASARGREGDLRVN